MLYHFIQKNILFLQKNLTKRENGKQKGENRSFFITFAWQKVMKDGKKENSVY